MADENLTVHLWDVIPPWPEPTPDPFPGKTRYVTPWTKEEA